MPKINVLDKHMAELIAAGEVVERPSSVVKELVENAVDAGAASLTVEVKNGGVSFLRVTDNGCGISREDVAIAFLRHATSKVRVQDDLEQIGTLGFRGEALASIAAVSHVELLTRTAEDLAGTRYTISGGEGGEPEDAGCAQGTTIVVRDIFYNVPARMKFLKKDVTEANAVAGVMDKLALSHPEVAVRFIRDGKETLHTPGDGKLKSAIYAVFGKEFTMGLIPVEYEYSGVHVTGFVSKPAAARPNRSMQSFFINGRYVKSRTMMVAMEEAFKGSLMVGKMPACVLHITLACGAVDVNVHPAKIEVRFINEKPIFDAVYHAVKTALNQGDTPSELRLPVRPEAPANKEAARPSPFASTTEQSAPKQERVIQQPDGSASFPVSHMEEGKEESPVQERNWTPAVPRGSYSAPVSINVFADDEAVPSDMARRFHTMRDSGAALPEGEENFPAAPSFAASIAKAQEGAVSEPLPTAWEGDGEAAPAAESRRTQTLEAVAKQAQIPVPQYIAEQESIAIAESEQSDPAARLVGEAFGTYILLERGDELVLIDKHAAHERMLYEKLKAEAGGADCQLLLSPVTVTLDKNEYAAVLDALELYKEAGFELEDFGSGTVLVRSAPMILGGEDIAGAVMEIAGYLQSAKNDLTTEKLDWLYHNVACRAAVKAGDESSPQELYALAQRLAEHPEIRYCPHGRPVSYILKRKELEKQFGRLG